MKEISDLIREAERFKERAENDPVRKAHIHYALAIYLQSSAIYAQQKKSADVLERTTRIVTAGLSAPYDEGIELIQKAIYQVQEAILKK